MPNREKIAQLLRFSSTHDAAKEQRVSLADYVSREFDYLAGNTRLWNQTWYHSTLPYWLLDRLQSTASILATGTTRWFEGHG